MSNTRKELSRQRKLQQERLRRERNKRSPDYARINRFQDTIDSLKNEIDGLKKCGL